MTIFNLLLLVLVLLSSTESMAAQVCVLREQCETTLLSHEALASRRNPLVGPFPNYPLQSYDELLLVLQWPTSFCNIKICDPGYSNRMPQHFTVHGLWFNFNSRRVCCPLSNHHVMLYPPMERDLSIKMQIYWPDLLNERHPGNFRQREYETHGRCVTGFQTDQVLYFRTAFQIAQLVYSRYPTGDVSAMRLRSGHTLVRRGSYHVTDFIPVTIDGKLFYPSLRCSCAKGKVQLQEIVFCTDMNRVPKPCSTYVQNCNGRFVFP